MTAAATSPLELLRDHIGHETRPIEPNPGRSIAIRCLRCQRTIDLSATFGLRPSSSRPGTTSTSTPAPTRRDPRPDETCPAHPGEWRDACRCCAAEAKAQPDDSTRPPTTRTGTDPTQHPAWQAARQRFGGKP